MAGMEYNLHNVDDEIDDEPLGRMMDRRREIGKEAGSRVVKQAADEDDYDFFTRVYEADDVGFSD